MPLQKNIHTWALFAPPPLNRGSRSAGPLSGVQQAHSLAFSRPTLCQILGALGAHFSPARSCYSSSCLLACLLSCFGLICFAPGGMSATGSVTGQQLHKTLPFAGLLSPFYSGAPAEFVNDDQRALCCNFQDARRLSRKAPRRIFRLHKMFLSSNISAMKVEMPARTNCFRCSRQSSSHVCKCTQINTTPLDEATPRHTTNMGK